jgi:putative cardiolipin synthase
MNFKLNLKLLIILTLILNFGCSQLPPQTEVQNREISSVDDENCRALLNKFLPLTERQMDETSATASFTKNILKFRENQKVVDGEAFDLFSTFEKEAKDLAAKSKFKLLVDPHEALLARLMLIKQAKKTIDLTYYIFQDSETSKLLLDELRQALRRGVNIRLMVDGSGSIAATKNFYKEIQVLYNTVGGNILDESGNIIGKAKFEAVEINPMFNLRANVKNWYYKVVEFVTGKAVPQNDFYLFHRSHDKILLVDAESQDSSMAIIGGRNISNHYYKLGTEEERDSTFNDLDILVKDITFTTPAKDGSVELQNVLMEHFNRLYYYSANKKFEDFIFKLGRKRLSKTLKEFKDVRTEMLRSEGTELNQILKKMEADDYLNKDFDQGYVSFLDEIENLTRKDIFKPSATLYENNKNSIMKNMWEQILKAEKEILICSPYIYLTDKEISELATWLKEDSSRVLKLITNSSATSDNLFAQSMVENFVMPKLIAELKKKNIPEKQFEILAYGNLDNKEFGGKIPQGKLHAKFWMIDNYAMGVGTSNFDPISRLTNSEIVANAFPTDGTKSVTALKKYYDSLKANSDHWDTENFYQAKFRPELKKKLIIQAFIAKVIKAFNLLPQSP